VETEFVDCSIQRRRNRLRRLVTSIVAVILSLSGLTAFVFIQSIDAQIQALSASSGLLLASN
jgi:cell division protein FtsB